MSKLRSTASSLLASVAVLQHLLILRSELSQQHTLSELLVALSVGIIEYEKKKKCRKFATAEEIGTTHPYKLLWHTWRE
jgi:hypothetical protein